ncbi:protein phosphatase CheZ [Paludibacterium paludis]|uniref:Protein phosphatase CheZ n=1 Tax=Paludibacterium paludis TaxID=1225769 RepID=A0A918P5I9_9NEIS|nr:protein phosphatase CheZ [Paludibacterium paludis]GGY21983.1 protein phosphatase CheZ [Paludibacterium paludis]
MPDHILDSGDSPELEALFDSIAMQPHEEAPAVDAPRVEAAATPAPAAVLTIGGAVIADPIKMYEDIGQLTRRLHDAMRDMGYDKSIERMAETLPDAKDRLVYIATLTESAAEKVLNATDIARPIQDAMEAQAQALGDRWSKLYANQLSVDEFRQLAADTRNYLMSVPAQTQATNTQLLDIVMAQDFQDLTGQVIKKMMDMVKIIETELLSFLIAYSPTEKKAEIDPGLLNGPVINPEGRSDVVANQQQVDDLLESLGF